jgi:hypothetical protein
MLVGGGLGDAVVPETAWRAGLFILFGGRMVV